MDTIFHRVTFLELTSREVPDALLKLRYLENLSLRNCQVSRDQLRRLNLRGSPMSLAVHNTVITGDTMRQVAERKRAQTLLDVEPISVPPSKPLCSDESLIAAYLCPSNAQTEEWAADAF